MNGSQHNHGVKEGNGDYPDEMLQQFHTPNLIKNSSA